ncbi:ligand-binding protein SH3 [Candidatus Falkowbacteria bacterium CG10_big_fil_rev_8_21_14_0_10_43_10]|uniref:Ligand-binding protein SH3 n=1 Tax=Candidatus Falkowbacteria bacterium CG10_big_fil_rev_8_21_14_0_10_43_10 TaxID=1974567 RepID=A0A2H0V332_9BACT|nr:MAG: ligand-binding protein SH3 [Candidatus Falkowbacteria bacterium CG10_big_fil_rev_8_21_14_0_10_43_10]
MHMINYLEIFKNIPPQIATMLIAMIPIAENRVSIPVALGAYQMSVFSAIFWSALGSILAAALVIFLLEKARRIAVKRLSWADKFFTWLYTRTERKFAKKYEYLGALALTLFVAIPLPMTGAWTGSLAAVVIGIKPLRALLFVSIGVILSAVIVALVSLGVINLT